MKSSSKNASNASLNAPNVAGLVREQWGDRSVHQNFKRSLVVLICNPVMVNIAVNLDGVPHLCRR
jgi:hypothetical protein